MKLILLCSEGFKKEVPNSDNSFHWLIDNKLTTIQIVSLLIIYLS